MSGLPLSHGSFHETFLFRSMIFVSKFWDCQYLCVSFEDLRPLSPTWAAGFPDLLTQLRYTVDWLLAGSCERTNALTIGAMQLLTSVLPSRHTLSTTRPLGPSFHRFSVSFSLHRICNGHLKELLNSSIQMYKFLLLVISTLFCFNSVLWYIDRHFASKVMHSCVWLNTLLFSS